MAVFIFGIEFVIVVMWGMRGMLQIKEVKSWTTHFQIQFSADHQYGVSHFLSRKFTAVHPPKPLITRINLLLRFILDLGLSVGFTHHKQLVQLLE